MPFDDTDVYKLIEGASIYAGMVDVGVADDDALYRSAVKRIWDDVVGRKLYGT